jgi:8-oxo-dGTP diphosphatase
MEQRQRVAAYGICVEDRRILLCRLSDRTESPGSWTLPGGGIDFGEHPADAVIREIEEETGLAGEVECLLAVDSFVVERQRAGDDVPAEHHGLRIVYAVTITGGSLRNERDESTDRADWFTRDEAAALPLVGIAPLVIDLAFETRPASLHRLR